MAGTNILEEFTIDITCSVNYSGSWAPVMNWQQDGGPVIIAGVVNKAVPYKSVTSSLTVLVTKIVTGSKFSCTTYFSEENKPITRAANVPVFSYVWISPEVTVSCKFLICNYAYGINTSILILLSPD